VNSLEELIDAIERRIRIIELAYNLLAKTYFEINGEEYSIQTSSTEQLYIEGSEDRVYLETDANGLRGIARNLRVFLRISEECKEAIEEELKRFEEEKELFSIFKLQEHC